MNVFPPVGIKLFVLVALLMAPTTSATGDDAMSLPTALKKHDVVLVAKATRRAKGNVSMAPELVIKGELDGKQFELSETWTPGGFSTSQTLLERKRYLLMLHRDESGKLSYSQHPIAESVREVDSVDDTHVRTAVVIQRFLNAPNPESRARALEKAWTDESDKVKERVLYLFLELGRDEATVPYLVHCIEAGAERSSLMEMAATVIGQFQYRQTVPVLLNALKKDHWSCVYPAQALAKLKVRDAYQPLMDLVNSPIAGNRVYFIEALCQLDDERSVPFLIETARRDLRGIDPAQGTYRASDIRENEFAVASLGRLRAKEAVDVLRQVAQQRTYDKLRQLAQEALEAISTKASIDKPNESKE